MVTARKSRTPDVKMNTNYRLPESLHREIALKAVDLRVRPCVVVEAALRSGLADAVKSLSLSPRSR